MNSGEDIEKRTEFWGRYRARTGQFLCGVGGFVGSTLKGAVQQRTRCGGCAGANLYGDSSCYTRETRH